MKTTLSIISILAIAGSLSYAEGDRKQRDRKRPAPGEIMKKLDTNGDGSVSKAEFLAGERAQKDPERAAKAFAHMDSDGDGSISTKDFAQRRKPGGEGGRKRPNPAEIMKKLDTNGDGNISKEEFLAGERAKENPERAGQHFDKLDANGDGNISRDEFAKRPNPGDRKGRGEGPGGDRAAGKPPGTDKPLIE